VKTQLDENWIHELTGLLPTFRCKNSLWGHFSDEGKNINRMKRNVVRILFLLRCKILKRPTDNHSNLHLNFRTKNDPKNFRTKKNGPKNLRTKKNGQKNFRTKKNEPKKISWTN
jgi:hypothetical protein